MSDWENRVAELEKRLDLVFTQRRLLKAALVHASYENGAHRRDQERLRQLGASAIQYFFTTELWVRFPDDSGDEVVRRRNFLLSHAFLADSVRAWGLHGLILVGKGVEEVMRSRCKARIAIVAQALEALVGLILIEHGEVVCGRLVRGFITSTFDWAEAMLPDPGRRLQEETQRALKMAPDYRVIDQTGHPHTPTFVMGAFLGQTKIGEGSGASHGEAKKMAAANALDNRHLWPKSHDS